MTIYELSDEQKASVKQNYYMHKQAEKGMGVSYGELAAIDNFVSDEEIIKEYKHVYFTPEDFLT